jgi:hypothetical protein
MEISGQPSPATDGIEREVRAFLAFIVFIICVECAKEPEYICEYCDKVYKQEARHRAHVAKCVEKDTRSSGNTFAVFDIGFNEVCAHSQAFVVAVAVSDT